MESSSVAITERMILAQMERVRSSHLIEISVQASTFKGGLRYHDSGADKSDVANAQVATIAGYLVTKNRNHL